MSKIKISKTENCKNSKLKFELFIFQHDSLHQCTPPQRGGNLLSNVGCSIAVRSFRSGALRKLCLAFTSNLREWPHQPLTALQNALFEMNGVQSWPVRTCMHSVHRQVSVACAALSFPLCRETWINGQCSLPPNEDILKAMLSPDHFIQRLIHNSRLIRSWTQPDWRGLHSHNSVKLISPPLISSTGTELT